jgi:hypothetical protein
LFSDSDHRPGALALVQAFPTRARLQAAFWQFAFSSMRHCPWARAYYDYARKRGKKHAEAVQMLGNVWLHTIIALRRTSRPTTKRCS